MEPLCLPGWRRAPADCFFSGYCSPFRTHCRTIVNNADARMHAATAQLAAAHQPWLSAFAVMWRDVKCAGLAFILTRCCCLIV